MDDLLSQREDAEAIGLDGAFLAPGIRQIAAAVWRRKLLCVAGMLVAYCIGVLYYYSRTPLYEAQASVLVHRTGETMPGQAVDAATAQLGYQSFLPNHIRLISSSAVLERAAARLRAAGDPALADVTAGSLAGGLRVTSQPDTEILDISHRSSDRRIPAVAVRAIVAAYQECVNETHRSTSKDILQILAQQKTQLDRQLADKEKELLDLQKAAGMVSLRDGKATMSLTRVTAVSQSLIQARLHRLELEATSRAFEDAVAQGKPIDAFLLRYRDKLVAEHVIVSDQSLRRDLLQDRAELRRLRETYGDHHPRVRALEERIRTQENLVGGDRGDRQGSAAERQNALKRVLDQELAEARVLESTLQEQLDREQKQALEQNAQSAQLMALEAELSRLHSFYDGFIQRMKQLNLGEDYGAIMTQVIEPPRPPGGPVWPSLQRVLLEATLLGLMFSLGLCYLFEWCDNSYRGADDIARHLKLPVMGHVPSVPGARHGQPAELLMHHSRLSTDAESFRTLRAALMLCENPPRQLGVTSPEPEDGKTLIATNLAIAFAQSGLRTLLIDADMRRSRVHEIFGLPRSGGLSKLLDPEHPGPSEYPVGVLATAIANLHVLPSGPHPPNPAELLMSKRFGDFLRWADGCFDRIVFDTPPILAVSDAAVLGRLLDATLLVVQADKNDRRSAARALGALRGMRCRVVGVVVNRVHGGARYGYQRYAAETRDDDSAPGQAQNAA